MLKTAAAVYAPIPGSSKACVERARKFSVVVRDDFLCRPMQIACAAVIAEAGPEFQNFGNRSARKRFDIRQVFQETIVVRHYGGDARLLQHYFGDPHAVGIAAGAPGKVAFVRAKPAQQAFLKRFELRRRKICFHARGILARFRDRSGIRVAEAKSRSVRCARMAVQDGVQSFKVHR